MYKWNFCLSIVIAGLGIYSYTPTSALSSGWDYMLDSFEGNGTDDKILNANMRPVRIERGVYGLNGTIEIGHDLDDEYQISIKTLRSPSGNSQYKLTPFEVPKCTMSYFMEKIYKQFLMKDIAACSDLPQFETWTGPFKRHVYVLNSCIVSTDSMPSYMQPGYYKLVFELSGPLVQYMAQTIVKVNSKF